MKHAKLDSQSNAPSVTTSKLNKTENKATESRDKGSKSGVATYVALFLLLAGAVLLFLPLAKQAYYKIPAGEEINKVKEYSIASSSGNENGQESIDLAATKEWFSNYNKKVASGELAISSDPFYFNDEGSSFSSQGIEDGLIGYIDIPKMDCNLPIYLGATQINMLKGATIVSGSSVPMDDPTSNCVIAAHRSYDAALMFRYIEKLTPGDDVRVTMLWGEYSYTVSSTKIIDPNDIAAVGIQQDKDLVTLMTCHPYGQNTSRYIVICERSGSNPATDTTNPANTTTLPANQDGSNLYGASLPEIEDDLRMIGGGIFLFTAMVLVIKRIKNKLTP